MSSPASTGPLSPPPPLPPPLPVLALLSVCPLQGSTATTHWPCSDWKRLCPYSPQSPSLLLPSAADAAQLTVLPLFAAASASPSGSGLAAAGAEDATSAAAAAAAGSDSSSPQGLSKAEATDVILNVGGPVWALDWCPAGTRPAPPGSSAPTSEAGPSNRQAPTGGPGPSCLAVGCHPVEAQRNTIGKAVEGPACIQLWEVGHPDQLPAQQGTAAGQQQQQQQEQRGQATQPRQQQQQQQEQQRGKGLQLPRMALALAHDGGVTWDCKWCPDPGLADDPSVVPGPGTLPRQASAPLPPAPPLPATPYLPSRPLARPACMPALL